ncbi:hypothetical protein BDV93DRAFT_517734 [Ceratobasidium sp. AG-I]|nr:hypothetical protein BDV93DRAFT_517734 [Ceratobasidium sp. AG-I]
MGQPIQEPQPEIDEMQELVSIMRDAANAFDATESLQIVLEIQEIMKKKEARWNTDIEQIRAESRTVAQAHQSARVASLRPPNVPSEEQHGRAVASLDEAQFRVIKAINDAESVLSSRQNERVRARTELSSWEAKDVDKDVASGLDTHALRIRLSKELGFEPVINKATGKITKMIVRNDDNTDMDVVELDELSETEAVNTLWEKATAVDRASS